MDWIMENMQWLFSGIAIAIPLTIVGWIVSSRTISKFKSFGDNTTNIQAEKVDIVQGLTYEQTKQVAADVFKANFYELAGEASSIAKLRAEQITEDFLSKLQVENPKGFHKAEDPDFQYALFTVQREYARNGDEDLGGLLVDLLVDRSKQDKRDILQIVLNESLSIAPKLTTDQLSALAVAFLFKYSVNNNVRNHDSMGNYLDKHLAPFVIDIPTNSTSYQHLEYAGCGTVSMGEVSLEHIFATSYQGLFSQGFEISRIEKLDLSAENYSRFFIQCLNNPDKLQVNAISKDTLKKRLANSSVSENDKRKISSLFDTANMNDRQIKEKCIEIRPYMEQVFDSWSNSELKNFSLTSVGIAIGHANIKRIVGGFTNLSIWIN